MNQVTLIGIDLGKHSFHLHAQDAAGRMVFRKKLSRLQLLRTLAKVPACRVAMEACAGSHWLARRLADMGHEARLISPQRVRPFVAGNKNDFSDAEAICEAACRPSMRFVRPRSEAQQTISALHRIRERLVRERTAALNQIHGFLLEFGISLPRGAALLSRLPAVVDRERLPPRLVALAARLREQVHYLSQQVRDVEQELVAALGEDDCSCRLLEIPGIGPITASALAVELSDAQQFANARQFSASIGLVPRQYSTGGKPTLLGISKRGDRNLRRLLVQCARAVMQHASSRADVLGQWVRDLSMRRHSNVVACALANKLARIAWAITARGTHYQAQPVTV